MPAEFSFGQLARLRDYIFELASTELSGIRSLDLDEVRNRVVVEVDPATVSSTAVLLATKARAVGEEASALLVLPSSEVQSTASSNSGNASSASALTTSQDLSATWNSLAGGIFILTSQSAPRTPSAGQPGACSLGFTAFYSPAVGSPYRAIVTASHCTAGWGAPDGTTFSQGGLQIAGTATVDPDKYHCGFNWCRASDAAMFQLSSSMPYELGLIVRTTFASSSASVNGSTTQDASSPWFVVTSTSNPPVGATYHKMGWASGWVSGVKLFSCKDHFLGNAPDAWVTRCGDQGSARNIGGDSGGSVFIRLDSNNVALIGTTVGNKDGQHFYSPYSRIASDMGGTMLVTRQANLSTPEPTGSVVSGHARMEWPAVSGATEYQVLVQEVTQQCDQEWGCWLVYGPEQSTTVFSPWWQDQRSTFVDVGIDPNSPHLRARVIAKNPMTANFSVVSSHVLFSLP